MGHGSVSASLLQYKISARQVTRPSTEMYAHTPNTKIPTHSVSHESCYFISFFLLLFYLITYINIHKPGYWTLLRPPVKACKRAM